MPGRGGGTRRGKQAREKKRVWEYFAPSENRDWGPDGSSVVATGPSAGYIQAQKDAQERKDAREAKAKAAKLERERKKREKEGE